MAKREKKRRPWIRWALLALALFVFYHILAGRNGLFKLAELRHEQRMAQSRIDSLAVRKEELEAEKQRLLTDSAYMEKLARQELGMAKPKEKVYRFVASASETTATSSH
jgi:cell division protein FtsB